MARTLKNLAADGNVTFTLLPPVGGQGRNVFTLYAIGTWGSGTLVLDSSPDAGTTYVDVNDSSGTQVSFTADGQVNFELQTSNSDPVILKATLSGSSSPDLDVILFDSRS